MSSFLIYQNAGCKTGPELAEELGIDHGRELDEHVDFLIRWGSTRGVSYIPDIQTFNLKRAVQNNTDKFQSLVSMKESHVPVPPFSRNINDLSYPVLARRNSHRQGRDIQLCLQSMDLQHLDDHDFFVEYIPKKEEYRVHVVFGDIVAVHKKQYRDEDEEYDPVIWNYENGFHFNTRSNYPPSINQASAAVNGLNLHFGAVDMIISENDEPYILEVNTAPSLREELVEEYASRFQREMDRLS